MTVQGLDHLNKRFNKIPKSVQRAVEDAMEKSADELIAMMKRLVPKRTGRLSRSIGWTWGEIPAGAQIFAQSKKQKGSSVGTITVYAGNEGAIYAPWVEFGTSQNAAHPFFFVSYRSQKKRIKARTKRAINKAING